MYTTRLLAIMDDVMPRRQRIVLAAIVVFLVAISIADALSRRPAQTTAQPAPIILIATSTPRPTGAIGLVKQAAPMVAPALSAPTAAPFIVPITSAPVYQTDERPSDKPAPPRSHERATDKRGPGE